MSTERIIHVADLTFIHNSLTRVREDIGSVSGQVEGVQQQVNTTRSELAQLEQLVRDFIAADIKAKELQLAETRQVKVRQELESTYGYYAQVRRQATGILQAADISIVRQETITSATEELMLSAPRYWLAPALVALAAWLNDNQPLATKALTEAIRRDDEKTSLFFSLVSRRAGRTSACGVWIDRYLGLQDPVSLDRQTVVLVDALASGVFGVEVRGGCSARIEGWIEELSQRAGFVDEQRKQWNRGLRSKIPNNDNATRYPYLAQHSAIWAKLDTSLNEAALHAEVRDYFGGIFEGALVPSRNIQAAVDDLLDKLVKNFDDEELPLRRDERMCHLIINEAGNRSAAQHRYDLENKALDEKVSFTQLLTNAAMHPETSHASRATQRFAIALSRQWIKDAHLDLTGAIRAAVPAKISLDIEGWNGETKNGENEQELTASLSQHLDDRLAKELGQVKLTPVDWIALVSGALLIVAGLPSLNWLLLAIGSGGIAKFWLGRKEVDKKKDQLRVDYTRLKEQCLQALKAALAETVELRRDLAQRDAVASEVTQLLDAISPQQYALSSHDNVRRVITSPAIA
jgi:hypothetical protein